MVKKKIFFTILSLDTVKISSEITNKILVFFFFFAHPIPYASTLPKMLAYTHIYFVLFVLWSTKCFKSFGCHSPAIVLATLPSALPVVTLVYRRYSGVGVGFFYLFANLAENKSIINRE